jgi:hypothetical protein
MLNNSMETTETGGNDVTDTSIPLLITAVTATQKRRHNVNVETGGCDGRLLYKAHIYVHIQHKNMKNYNFVSCENGIQLHSKKLRAELVS